MFIETKRVQIEYTRPSKLGLSHTYKRTQTLVVMECDVCSNIFERTLSTMDRRRLDNQYHHVCSNCDAKRFAQKKGVERRRLWNLPVDSDLKIGRL
jgi:hypothetical protein